MTKPLRVVSAYYNDVSNPSTPTRRPISIMSWADWIALSNTSTLGPPNQIFVDKQQTTMNVWVWNTPDAYSAANGTLQIQIQQQVQNFTGITDNMNFPVEWFMGLRWGLAEELSTGQPAAIIQRCTMKAETLRKALEDWDVEDASTRFVPDARGGSNSSKFR